MNRDVVCQLPPEASHPPNIAARLKKHAYGMNDAPRRWLNILDKALCSYGMVPTKTWQMLLCITLNEFVWANLEPRRLFTMQKQKQKQHLKS